MNYSQQILIRWLEWAVAGASLLAIASVAVSRLKQPRDRINCVLTAHFAVAIVAPLVGIAPLSNWHLGLIGAGERSEVNEAAELAITDMKRAAPREASPQQEGSRPHVNTQAQPTEELVVTPETSSAIAVTRSRNGGWRILASGLGLSYFSVTVLFLINSIRAANNLRGLAARAYPAEETIMKVWRQTTGGCGERVRVLVTSETTSPLVYGWLRPIVLIPASIADGNAAELKFCLAHEWAHISNNDLRIWWFTWACQFVLWFQPLYWRLRRELRVCQDVLADRQAAGEIENRIEYSELLLRLARSQAGRSPVGVISFIDDSSQLARRIKSLVASPLTLRDRSPRMFCVAIGMISLTAAFMAGSIRVDSAVADEAEKSEVANKQNANGDAANHKGESVETNAVSGRVVDEFGAPLENAQVWLLLRYRPRRIIQATTDKSGHFELKHSASWIGPDITSSSWTIWAYAPNHSIATESAFRQLRGMSNDPVELKLGGSSECSFKVLSPSREPLAGVTVQPQNYKTRAGYELVPEEILPAISARTDAEGIAKLPAIEANPLFRVQVVSEEFGDQSLRVDNHPDNLIREIPLRATGRIEGRLVGDRPEWLKGVRLTFATDNQEEWSDARGQATVVTDEDGKFVVPAIGSGGPLHTYVELDPSLPVRPRLNDEHYIEAGETLRLEIPLISATKVFGKVVAKTNGKPVAKAIILLGYGGFHQSEHVVSDDDGRFEAFVLPGPVHSQCISLPEGFEQLGEPWAEAREVPADVSGFEMPPIEVVGTHAVTGRLIGDKDQPLGAMQLTAINKNRRYGFASTDSDGRFTMRVPDGIDTDITVFSERRGSVPVEVVQKDPLVVRYTADTHEQIFERVRATKADVVLSGRVLSNDTPLAGVKIFLKRGIPVQLSQRGGKGLYGAESSMGMRMEDASETETDADGRFRVTGLKAGDSYQIEVKPAFSGSDPAWQHQSPWMPKLPDDASGEVKLPDVKLRKLDQSLAGQVVDPDGKPVEGAQVSAMLHDGFQSVPRSSLSGPPTWTVTDRDGRFKLQQLPDESLVIMAYINTNPENGGPIRYPARVNVERNQQDIRIVLDPSLVKDE